MPKITVFTVVYNNYGHFIPQWVNYLKRQTEQPKMIIVLGKNHGADTDWLDKNKIDYVLCDSDNMGVLRNAGLEQVKTEWWFYFAIDDELLPHACEEIINTDADAVSIRFDCIDVDGKLLKDQQSPYLTTIENIKNWRNTKWGGYTAIRGNTDLRYNEDVEVPNLTLHFDLFKKNLKVVKSKSILVVHHRWSESHHFKSEKNGSRKNSIGEIDRIAQKIVKEKEDELMNKRYIVEANENWKKENLKCNDFNPKKIPEVNEQWEVDGIRLEVLQGKNSYRKSFVNVVKEIDDQEEVKIELTSEIEQTTDGIVLTTFADGEVIGKIIKEETNKETPKSTTKKKPTKKLLNLLQRRNQQRKNNNG